MPRVENRNFRPELRRKLALRSFCDDNFCLSKRFLKSLINFVDLGRP